MIDTAFIFQVPAHYPVVTFVSSSFFSPSRAREKKEGYNRQIQPEEIDEPNEVEQRLVSLDLLVS